MYINFQILSSVNGWRESNRCLISSRIGTGFFSGQDVKYSYDVLPKDAKPEKGNYVSVDDAGRIILNGKPFMPIGMYVIQTDTISVRLGAMVMFLNEVV